MVVWHSINHNGWPRILCISHQSLEGIEKRPILICHPWIIVVAWTETGQGCVDVLANLQRSDVIVLSCVIFCCFSHQFLGTPFHWLEVMASQKGQSSSFLCQRFQRCCLAMLVCVHITLLHNVMLLTLNIPSLGYHSCLPSWGHWRTPWFFFYFSVFVAVDYSKSVL